MTSTDTPTPATSIRTPKETVEALYAAFGAGDRAALLDTIDPDVDWSIQVDAPGAELVPMLRNGVGHEAVDHYFSGVADLDIEIFVPHDMVTDGDTVLARIELAFTHTVTGKRAHLEEMHRFVVRDGRIVLYRPYIDTATLIEAFRP